MGIEEQSCVSMTIVLVTSDCGQCDEDDNLIHDRLDRQPSRPLHRPPAGRLLLRAEGAILDVCTLQRWTIN